MGRRVRKKTYKKWREAVVERDKVCVVCGKPPPYLNAHHLIPSLFSQYQYDVENGIALCPQCHTLGKWSAHKNPVWFTNWLRTNKGYLLLQISQRLQELEELKDEKEV